jgi:hypothetical protein
MITHYTNILLDIVSTLEFNMHVLAIGFVLSGIGSGPTLLDSSERASLDQWTVSKRTRLIFSNGQQNKILSPSLCT